MIVGILHLAYIFTNGDGWCYLMSLLTAKRNWNMGCLTPLDASAKRVVTVFQKRDSRMDLL